MTNGHQAAPADHAGTLYMWLRAAEQAADFDGSVHLEMARGKITRIEIRHDLTLPVTGAVAGQETRGLHSHPKRV